MRAIHRIASAAAVLGAASAVFVPAAMSAAATPACTAYGSLPARVSMRTDHVVIHSQLRGSSGCSGQRTDNGAGAYLHRPGQPAEDLRWRRFGSTQSVGLYVNLDKTGRYTINAGDVQLYGADYRQVSYHWDATTVIVKHAGRFRHTAVTSSGITGRAMHYSKFGWAGSAGIGVAVQRRTIGTSTWHTVRTEHADSSGWVSFGTALTPGHEYRLVSAQTGSVWSAHSNAVR